MMIHFFVDSVIFTWSPGEWAPEIGPYLGQMSDEMKDRPPGTKIVEFLSAGPKNYGIRIREPKSDGTYHYDDVVKVKGFRLAYCVGRHINFKNMRRLIKAYVKRGRREEGIIVVHPKIDRKIDTERRVVTKNVCRKYRVVYDKRRVLCDYSTRPYGY
jgi:hypothetical protein